MLSAISAQGIRPENDADVYPYVTLAMYLRANCRLFWSLMNDLLSSSFMLSFTMTLVSNISESIFASSPRLTDDFTYINPLGATIPSDQIKVKGRTVNVIFQELKQTLGDSEICETHLILIFPRSYPPKARRVTINVNGRGRCITNNCTQSRWMDKVTESRAPAKDSGKSWTEVPWLGGCTLGRFVGRPTAY